MNEKVDNTGNVRTWPSEEVLAYYLSKKDDVKSKSIIELGAGQSGLAGLVYAQRYLDSEIVITDGNKDCVTSKYIYP